MYSNLVYYHYLLSEYVNIDVVYFGTSNLITEMNWFTF